MPKMTPVFAKTCDARKGTKCEQIHTKSPSASAEPADGLMPRNRNVSREPADVAAPRAAASAAWRGGFTDPRLCVDRVAGEAANELVSGLRLPGPVHHAEKEMPEPEKTCALSELL